MIIFFEGGFESGKWAGGLSKLLQQAKIIDDQLPKARVWRATWYQWIQFEPVGHVGPGFWLGKPAILSANGFLYVGYYVERGLLSHPSHPDYVITPQWQWHGFIKCLQHDLCRRTLNSLMQDLPEERRCLWVRIVHDEQGILSDQVLSYGDEPTIMEFMDICSQAPTDHWVEVMLGVRFSKEECLQLQKKIVVEMRQPLIRADEIRWLAKQQLKD